MHFPVWSADFVAFFFVKLWKWQKTVFFFIKISFCISNKQKLAGCNLKLKKMNKNLTIYRILNLILLLDTDIILYWLYHAYHLMDYKNKFSTFIYMLRILLYAKIFTLFLSSIFEKQYISVFIYCLNKNI